MSFNTDNLSEYVNLKSQEIAVKAIMTPKTADLLVSTGNAQAGLKPGTHKILKLDQTVSFQSGEGCGRTPGTGPVLSEKDMEIVAIKENLNLCPKALYRTFYSIMLAKGQNPETEFANGFVDFIIDNRTAIIAAEIEKLIWKGDKTLTGANNLKYINGFLKQITVGGNGTYISLTDESTDIVTKLQNNWLAMPEEIKNQEDFRIFISETEYNKYLVAAANKNYFNPSEPFKVYGTTATLVPTPGLNGTGKEVYAKLSDLAYGLDGEGDSDSAMLKYSMETEQWYLDYRFALGVGIVQNSQIGITE